MDWNQYQEEVATVFRSVGLSAETNIKVKGIRGNHLIDVLVTFDSYGQKIIWICECKLWKSSIPKEKILTLYQIVQDVGADKGFLFSEKGFQSGAIAATKNTNLILTSLDEIIGSINDSRYEVAIINALKKIDNFRIKGKDFWIDDLSNLGLLKNIKLDEVALIDGVLMYMSLQIQKALKRAFPLFISKYKGTETTCICNNEEELIRFMHSEIEIINNEIEKQSVIANISKSEIIKLKNELSLYIEELIESGDKIILIEDFNEKEIIRIGVAKKMRQIGNTASELKLVCRGTLKIQVYEIMRILIDTIYLYLSHENIDIELWNISKSLVLRKIVLVKTTIKI